MPKGSKTCSKCQKECGPRTKICTCGNPFSFKTKDAVLRTVSNTENGTKTVSTGKTGPILPTGRTGPTGASSKMLVFIPGQQPSSKQPFCPIPLKSTSEVDVLVWLDKIKNYSFPHYSGTAQYSRAAIKYFVEYLVPRYTKTDKNPDFVRVIEIIDKNMAAYAEELMYGYETETY